MSVFASALYAGAVTHRRTGPRPHALRYAMFQMLFDLDELARLDFSLALFSRNRWNLVGFHDRDHGDGRAPLRAYVDETLAGAGIDLDGGPVRLLCMPRILGFVFNPLSIYFCHRKDGALAALLYEVNNTFGERHSYLIPVEGPAEGEIRQSCAKRFFVSPFMDMAMTYDFAITPPGEAIATTVHGRDLDGTLLIAAAFTGERVALTDGALAAALVRFPLLTLKVVAGIHLEALKMLAKGLRLRPRPPPPAAPVSVSRATLLRPEILHGALAVQHADGALDDREQVLDARLGVVGQGRPRQAFEQEPCEIAARL